MKLTAFKAYQKLDRYEHDRESMYCQAHEKGLKEPNDEIVINEAKYHLENAPSNSYYELLFNGWGKDEPEEYKSQKRDYDQLKRFCKKYCEA